jgi:hypothetical protein
MPPCPMIGPIAPAVGDAGAARPYRALPGRMLAEVAIERTSGLRGFDV